ncbi:MAG: hypothetical protein K0R71_1081 [Bacillales bacterium]|nr:hypothetical protein [Bacillales bacterium]
MKYVFAAMIILHGLIHLMGGVHVLGIAKIEELSQPTIISMDGWVKTIYGVTWFLAVLVFLVAGFGLLTNQSWWKSVAFAAVLLSQILIIAWWPAAKIGTIPNILVIIALFLL